MPQRRLSVRKIRDILRLKSQGLSDRQIASGVGIARSTVAECIRRAQAAQVSWPIPEALSDSGLEDALYPRRSQARIEGPPPDWARIHQELRRPGVTLQLLWEEYAEDCPGGYRYSRFCDLYREFASRTDRVMRQSHGAGEKLFVDYSGQTVEIVDRASGEVRHAQVEQDDVRALAL